MQFDSIQIGAIDLDDGARQYGILLGHAGVRQGDRHRFQLERGAVELIRGQAGVRSLRFRPDRDARAATGGDYHGITVRLDATEHEPTPALPAGVPHAIDHVVVQSPDLDRAITLWRDRLGVRLALDRDFPQRSMRILFFRSAGVTLEFGGGIGNRGDGPDVLWGVAYQVADVGAWRNRLLAAGVEVSEVRAGHKKGTFVATAKSHTLGVPTLLIQPVDEQAPGRVPG